MYKKNEALSQPDYQTLFENIPGLYLILLPDFTIIAVSNSYAAATMTEPEQIIGKNLFEVFPDNPDDKFADGENNLRHSLNTVLKTKQTHTMAVQKYDIRNADGVFEVRWWSPLNKPLLDQNGEVQYIMHRAEDVTQYIRTKEDWIEKDIQIEGLERKVNEMEMEIYTRAQQIQKMNTDLENQVEQRTAQLHDLNQHLEKKVEERTYQLAAANKELEAFSYSVSHDLRAPLRAINGFSDILAQKFNQTLDPEAKRLLGIIKTNALSMGQLIDDLLSFSRTGRKELSLALTDMQSLVFAAINELLPNETDKIKIITLKKMPPAQCDLQLMRQVWLNLISNAIKYSSKKQKPEIEIGAMEQNNETIYYIKDNGAGFDMLYADKLFGVFQRLHSQKEFEGNGVGLTLVQRIITKHKGRIWAEAALDKGATFYFTLTHEHVNT